MRIGFTGTRSVPDDRLSDVREFVLRETVNGTEFTSGACVGFDALAAAWCLSIRPWGVHRLCVPANRKQVDANVINEFVNVPHQFFTVVEFMPGGTDYRYRNTRIVQHADILVAVAEYPELHGKSTRSGTWQTVRIARREGTPVREFVIHP